eukprot:1533648-Prymnesium_polylepis.1
MLGLRQRSAVAEGAGEGHAGVYARGGLVVRVRHGRVVSFTSTKRISGARARSQLGVEARGSCMQTQMSMSPKHGERAAVVGVVSRPQLNGKKVRLQEFDEARGRWCVKFEGEETQLWLRPENLNTLACSLCLEEGLDPACFCSVQCQQQNWKAHKQWHKSQKRWKEVSEGGADQSAQAAETRRSSAKVASSFPDNELAQLLNQAVQLETAMKYRKAAAVYRKAITRYPDERTAYHNLAVTLTRSNDLVGACKSALKGEEVMAEQGFRGKFDPQEALCKDWAKTWSVAFSLLKNPDCAGVATPAWWNDADLLRLSDVAVRLIPDETEIDVWQSRAAILVAEGGRWMDVEHLRRNGIKFRSVSQYREAARCFRRQAKLIPYMAEACLACARTADLQTMVQGAEEIFVTGMPFLIPAGFWVFDFPLLAIFSVVFELLWCLAVKTPRVNH